MIPTATSFDVVRDFHAADFRRAARYQARISYQWQQNNLPGNAPRVTFTMPKRRAFAPQLTRRALRNLRQLTGCTRPAKCVERYVAAKAVHDLLRTKKTDAAVGRGTKAQAA